MKRLYVVLIFLFFITLNTNLAFANIELLGPGKSSPPGDYISNLNPVLTWNSDKNNSYFKVTIYIRDNNSLVPKIVREWLFIKDTSLRVPDGVLLPNKTYFWTVTDMQSSTTNNYLYFTTVSPIIVEILEPGSETPPGSFVNVDDLKFIWKSENADKINLIVLRVEKEGKTTILSKEFNSNENEFDVSSNPDIKKLFTNGDYEFYIVATSGNNTKVTSSKFFRIK
ncbi:hypothetical protein Thena_1416 [Thermodesulfobium narugense DSM 14796]|uniref:Uncharacterized protein n=1 Tax=Thermodesulfobium narugense DSM 14796 TaxID=747365 RepID=M1E6X5_9BACT|nr:hypothetical protein [Thermodesulfobium narugense]AEE15031.1 hypothetical protein Thena_1416 [Thermodesulfobium narugense DSM 14796]